LFLCKIHYLAGRKPAHDRSHGSINLQIMPKRRSFGQIPQSMQLVNFSHRASSRYGEVQKECTRQWCNTRDAPINPLNYEPNNIHRLSWKFILFQSTSASLLEADIIYTSLFNHGAQPSPPAPLLVLQHAKLVPILHTS